MPYIARKDYAEQTEPVGNGQCVSLVKELAGAFNRPASVGAAQRPELYSVVE